MNVAKFQGMIAATTLMLLLQVVPAEAQSFRTWVSSGGSDSNACSRTQPCRTFIGALAKTNAGGEINCVDSGLYPAIVITKPITIDCGGTLAAIGAGLLQNLIDVNISEASFPNATVRLRNLALNQGGVAVPAVLVRGGGAEVHIENCTIAGGQAAVIFLPASSLDLFIRDSFISGSGGTGLTVQSGSVRARVSLNNVRLDHNVRGISVFKSGTANTFVFLENVQIESSTGTGIAADGTGAFVFLSNSTVAFNGTAFSETNGAKIRSFGNNTVAGNANLGSTPTPRELQ